MPRSLARNLHAVARAGWLALGLGALFIGGASVAKEPSPTPSRQAFDEHVGRMPLYMSIVYTNQPDRDFASLLAGHRRGLVELAQIELQHGADPEMRAIAQRIVDASAKEDTALEAWRKRHGSR
jgi:uncharacterized protein (DUF305 family)